MFKQEADRRARDGAPTGTARRATPVRARGAPAVKERLTAPVARATDAGLSDVVWLADAGGVVSFLEVTLPRDTWVIVIDGSGSDLAENVVRTVRRASAGASFWMIHDGKAQADRKGTLAEDAVELDLTDRADAAVRDNLVADLVIITERPTASRDDRIRRWQKQAASMLIEGPAQAIPEHVTASAERPAYILLAMRPADQARPQEAGATG